MANQLSFPSVVLSGHDSNHPIAPLDVVFGFLPRGNRKPLPIPSGNIQSCLGKNSIPAFSIPARLIIALLNNRKSAALTAISKNSHVCPCLPFRLASRSGCQPKSINTFSILFRVVGALLSSSLSQAHHKQ